MDTPCFIGSSLVRHLACFHILAIINEAAVSIHVQIFCGHAFFLLGRFSMVFVAACFFPRVYNSSIYSLAYFPCSLLTKLSLNLTVVKLSLVVSSLHSPC